MTITADPLEWDSNDTANLRIFLGTKTGTRLVPKLAESAPTLFEDGETNKVLIRTGALVGFQQAVRTILLLSVPEPEAPKTDAAYPSLDEDSAWESVGGTAAEKLE